MASWTLIPCLKCLFAEFDRIAPGRDHASDGSVGDTVHQHEVSDHNPDETGSVPIHDADKVNEVHAIDVDNNLNESDLTMEKVVQFLLGRCRSGEEKRLRYIIYNRRIWSASSNWVQKTYTGASPHTEHAHFSASYTSGLEASTASWHLEDIPVALTDADWQRMENLLEGGAVSRGLRGQPNNLSDSERNQLTQQIVDDLTPILEKVATDTVAAWLSARYGNKVYPARYLEQHENDMQDLRDLLADPTAAAKIALNPASGLAKLLAAADAVLATAKK